MDSTFDLMNLYFVDPRRALRRMSDVRPVGLALFVFVCALISTMLAFRLNGDGGTGAMIRSLTFGVFGLAGLWFVSRLVSACVYHFVAGIVGAGGSAKSCLVLLMVNTAPFCLMTPLALMTSAIPEGVLVMTALTFVIWMVSMILNIIAIQENYRMEFVNAFFAVVADVLVTMFLPGMVMTMGVIFLIGLGS